MRGEGFEDLNKKIIFITKKNIRVDFFIQGISTLAPYNFRIAVIWQQITMKTQKSVSIKLMFNLGNVNKRKVVKKK